MNVKRFISASIAVFLFIFFYDWVFHGIYLRDLYMQTQNIWRPETEMTQYFGWVVGGQALLSVIFCAIFLKGYENRGIFEGVRYGFLIALLMTGPMLIMYAVQPIPIELLCNWVVGELIQYTVAGGLLAAIYKA